MAESPRKGPHGTDEIEPAGRAEVQRTQVPERVVLAGAAAEGASSTEPGDGAPGVDAPQAGSRVGKTQPEDAGSRAPGRTVVDAPPARAPVRADRTTEVPARRASTRVTLIVALVSMVLGGVIVALVLVLRRPSTDDEKGSPIAVPTNQAKTAQPTADPTPVSDPSPTPNPPPPTPPTTPPSPAPSPRPGPAPGPRPSASPSATSAPTGPFGPPLVLPSTLPPLPQLPSGFPPVPTIP